MPEGFFAGISCVIVILLIALGAHLRAGRLRRKSKTAEHVLVVLGSGTQCPARFLTDLNNFVSKWEESSCNVSSSSDQLFLPLKGATLQKCWLCCTNLAAEGAGHEHMLLLTPINSVRRRQSVMKIH